MKDNGTVDTWTPAEEVMGLGKEEGRRQIKIWVVAVVWYLDKLRKGQGIISDKAVIA